VTTPVLCSRHRLSCLMLAAWLVVSLFSTSWAKKEGPVPVPRPSGTVFDPPGAPGFVVPAPPGMVVPKHKGPQSPAPGQPFYIEDKHRPPKAFPAPPPAVFHNRPPPPPPRYREHRDYYSHAPWDYRHRPHYGSVHRHLPSDTFRFFLGGIPFFYIGGVYFQSGPGGYVVVTPPIGARIQVLPEGCSYFYFHGRRCYSCDDVFYEELDNAYVVIERPPRFRLIAEAGDEVLIETDTLNVRSGPGRRYDTINLLQRDETVEVGAVDGDWYYVNLRNGSYGWIMRKYTRIVRFGGDPKG
jgi:hypothetical protein